jgi:hypothetical protein
MLQLYCAKVYQYGCQSGYICGVKFITIRYCDANIHKRSVFAGQSAAPGGYVLLPLRLEGQDFLRSQQDFAAPP